MITPQELVLELGLRRCGHTWVGTCPACGYQDAFNITEKDGTSLYYCHSCQDSNAIWAELKRTSAASNGNRPTLAATMRKDTPKKSSDAWVHLWERSTQSKGTLVEVYLRSRGLNKSVCPDIRFLSSCFHKDSNQYFPVMLSGVRAVNGQLMAVHRTYLRPDGEGKAPVIKPKMSLGAIKGGAIRLGEAGTVLGVSEGIETGLAFQQETGVPVWAAIACGIMPDLILPALPLAKEVVIAADPDPVGMKFAKQAAKKWTAQGRIVRIAIPPCPGQDFADLLKIKE
jgi:putative DNA primase/helicase